MKGMPPIAPSNARSQNAARGRFSTSTLEEEATGRFNNRGSYPSVDQLHEG